jgi:hypothetical protein
MPLKVGQDTVITDLKILSNIANTDITTRNTINDAVVRVNNVLVIKDSAGNAVKTIYGGDDTI